MKKSLAPKENIKVTIKRKFPFLSPFYRFFKYGVRVMPGKITYDEDGLITNHSCDFLYDDRFSRSLAIAMEAGHFYASKGDCNTRWRIYTACWAADIGKNLEGDFVECGVLWGSTSRTIMEYIGFKNLNKKFYLLDTYEGMDERYLTPTERGVFNSGLRNEETSAVYSFVKKAFAEFPEVIIAKGAVPDTLEQVKSEKIAYLHIDMLSTIPEISAAKYFWPKMVSGAVMLLDDYGQVKEQHDAFDDFARERGVSILCLPTGQGLIIKP